MSPTAERSPEENSILHYTLSWKFGISLLAILVISSVLLGSSLQVPQILGATSTKLPQSPMTQTQHHKQVQFLQKCEEADRLVVSFLQDTLPTPPARDPPYTFRPQRRLVVKEKVKKLMEVLDESLRLHSLDEIAISFNGGKDCLVMLVLLMATIHRKFSSDSTGNPKFNMLLPDYRLDSIYINSEEPFPELTLFIQQSTAEWGLNPITIKTSLKEGFEQYLESVHHTVKAIVVGIRYADPYGSQLKYEQATDHNWPKFLRIHPILHWHYVDIWDFLLACQIDYCSLYDKGYTSLGGVDTTEQNVFLKTGQTFLPAYMLEEYADERERVGRRKRQ